jgi:hypothetical protein
MIHPGVHGQVGSPNRIGWDGLGRDGKQSNAMQSDGMGWDGMGWDGMGWNRLESAGIGGDRRGSAGIDRDQRGRDRLGSVGEAAAKGDESIRMRVSGLSKKTRFMAKNKT